MLARRSLIAAAALAPFAGRAQEAYPSRPIRIVIAYPPGGSTDVLGRALAQRLSEMWNGAAVVVENKPGGAATIGTRAVAEAAPDGYTLALGNNQTHASNQAMMKALPYHAIDSFAPIARLASVHHALIVPASGARTLAELVAKGTNGGKVSYASTSVGSASHMIGESLARRFRMDATHVPYRGGGPAVTDTVAGVVDYFVSTWPQVVTLVREGKLRALAIGAPQRLPDAPDVPTFDEVGASGVSVDAWFGLWAPAGTPAPIVAKLAEAVVAIVNEPPMQERLRAMGFNAAPLGPAAFAAFQRDEVARWQALVELTGIRME
ncbi:tripartite tricarboxylate transporter substrate binding protein [Elioraea sp. Yellowstone]|jgi:tripartite-type tricarboxylate transporter receptor subunit TctC|uniref:Bug family tripartite tricarboxylate transporter substrate binding protein n=1 Tax=Elioraea sp. Yellowstone TaxID=2592070 RepID=UPI00115263AF|nr:tripartite tricarboxylate transporter substrate binding protein [Elioraea sp. Yellowstone]TQF78482.1 tripartite tricarboxylate transporter substrate binding protein [Elioraea sp. Yellowstone]